MQTQQSLEVHFRWWCVYYHFVRPHGSLCERREEQRPRGGRRVPRRYQKRTPAMGGGRDGSSADGAGAIEFPSVRVTIPRVGRRHKQEADMRSVR